MKKSGGKKRRQTKELFTVSVDKNKLSYETIEQDESGRIVLHKSKTTNRGSGYGEEDEYYVLSKEEYERYKKSQGKKKKK